ncbi:Fc receptor-like protein 5 isoform X2 [Tamandua tetradactyla]|uniref:Fc receptor-like protein 5 isoform X2 n=1 Tax=Tamandua tetradactyla TaxID=48850 RepID=UPI00405437B3
MLRWVSLLALALVSEQLATVPVISLQPPWTTVFQRELVLLTCHGFHDYTTGKTKWYHEDPEYHRSMKEIPGNTLEVNNSGVYRCQVQDSPLSNPVNLIFTSASLILQAPLWVFEGDSVILRCRTKDKASLDNMTLYKNRKVLKTFSKDSDFYIRQASLRDNGEYHCVGSKGHSTSVSSNSITIQVQDLFPQPQLKASPSRPTEGSPVTLTCETQLPLQRPDSQLQFRFFKNEQALELGWSSSPEIQITAVRKEDPEYYQCQAGTVKSSIRKQSQKISITVPIPMSHPVLTLSAPKAPAVQGDEAILHCEAQMGSPPILYQFYHESIILKNIEVKSRRSASFSFTLTAERSGNYHCMADNGLGTQSSRVVSLSVTVPVSHPSLTIRTPKTVEGQIVTLFCEAKSGSSRILYQFFHKEKLLGSSSAPSGGGASFSFCLATEHSGNYHCTADNGFGPQTSEAVSISVMVPASRPVLTLRTPRAHAVVGDVVELHCEAERGSPPILYRFYRGGITLGSKSDPLGGGASFNLPLTTAHSGSYSCTADNNLGIQYSVAVSLRVTVPVSRPLLTLGAPQAVVGDLVELHCEVQRGSPPILYRFYHKNVTLGSISAPSGEGASFNRIVTPEHSGNYSCEAENVLGAQRSEVVPLNVTVPASRPVLTLRTPRAQAVVGDVVELHCEAERGSPPILYRFYHEDITLGNGSAPSGGGVSINLSLTVEHNGNYSCDADNGLGPQRSEVLTLHIRGLTGNSGPVAAGVTGGLLSLAGLAAVALLGYCGLARKAGKKSISEPIRSPPDFGTQEPTYHNLPASIEMQPVYCNVNPNGREIVYLEVQCVQKKKKHAATNIPGLLKDKDSSVIYAQVKAASTPTI